MGTSFWIDPPDKDILRSLLGSSAQTLIFSSTQEQNDACLDLTIREASEIVEELRKELTRVSHLAERLKSLEYQLTSIVGKS